VALVAKPGTRLRSQTCASEVVVVKGPDADVDLRCGGVPMLPIDVGEGPATEPVAPFDGGTLLGKRYVDEIGSLEVLCTKTGEGSLSIGDTPLDIKGAKPLPASD